AAPLRGIRAPTDRPAVSGTLAADGERITNGLGLVLSPAQGVALLGAWATVFGLVSLELFGHTHNVVTDHEAFFAHHVDALAADFGL
ncbi:MAG TPA: TetR-like C-terminal domain-containing protein, partial [Acidimicrobiales bacterium]